jgi:hypothetical protein
MAAVKTNEGIDLLEKVKLGVIAPLTYQVKLYTNVVTPAVTSVDADFTGCVLTGGAAQNLTGPSWVVVTTSGTSVATYPVLTWTFAAYAGGTTIYGYEVRDTTSGKSLWGENFATPFAVPAAGGALALTLTDTGT